jgi:hypothetical protein
MQEKLLLSSSIAQRCLHRLSPAALLLSPRPSLRCLLVIVTTHKQRTKNLRTRTRLQSATQKSKENGYEMEETKASHPSTNG